MHFVKMKTERLCLGLRYVSSTTPVVDVPPCGVMCATLRRCVNLSSSRLLSPCWYFVCVLQQQQQQCTSFMRRKCMLWKKTSMFCCIIQIVTYINLLIVKPKLLLNKHSKHSNKNIVTRAC